MKKRLWLLAASLLTGGLALAQPKTMPAYANLGVTAGKAGGSLTLSLASAPQTFFYYGAIDAAIQNLANQMFDGLIEYNLANYQIYGAMSAGTMGALSPPMMWFSPTHKLWPTPRPGGAIQPTLMA